MFPILSVKWEGNYNYFKQYLNKSEIKKFDVQKLDYFAIFFGILKIPNAKKTKHTYNISEHKQKSKSTLIFSV
jgi:hypothetical protein